MPRIVAAPPPATRLPPFREVSQPIAIRSAKALSLLLVLESLRQSEINLGAPENRPIALT